MDKNNKNVILTYNIPTTIKGHKEFEDIQGARAFQRYLSELHNLRVNKENQGKYFRVIYTAKNDD